MFTFSALAVRDVQLLLLFRQQIRRSSCCHQLQCRFNWSYRPIESQTKKPFHRDCGKRRPGEARQMEHMMIVWSSDRMPRNLDFQTDRESVDVTIRSSCLHLMKHRKDRFHSHLRPRLCCKAIWQVLQKTDFTFVPR